MIKAILFDIDGVLIDSFEANLLFFQELMVKAGYPPPTREQYQRLFPLSLHDVIATLSGSSSPEEIQRVVTLGKSRDVSYEVDRLVLPHGAERVLQELHRQYLLGIVTNRERAYVFESPHLAKLQSLFKTCIAYEDVTRHKPDPEPLLLAAKKLGVLSNECLYIGDAQSDLDAARSAEMKFLHYGKVPLHETLVSISDFSQIPRILHSFQSKD